MYGSNSVKVPCKKINFGDQPPEKEIHFDGFLVKSFVTILSSSPIMYKLFLRFPMGQSMFVH